MRNRIFGKNVYYTVRKTFSSCSQDREKFMNLNGNEIIAKMLYYYIY